MRIRILCVGHLKEAYWKAAEEEYLKRLSPYANVSIEEVDDLPSKENASLAMDLLLPEATSAVNQIQPLYFLKKIYARYPNLQGVHFALLGLAYKAGTSDLRNALSLTMAKPLLDAGALIKAYDPSISAREAFKKVYPSIELCATKEDALRGADAILIITEEREFASLDEKMLLSFMAGRVIFDGRNLYPLHHFAYFDYVSVGRPVGEAQNK